MTEPRVAELPGDGIVEGDGLPEAGGWAALNDRYLAASLHWLRLRCERTGDDALEAAAADRQRATRDGVPALMELAYRLGMSPFERDLVLLCAAVELDP